MGTRYLYFNKTAFKELVRTWRKTHCPDVERFKHHSDEWLMETFIPYKFIWDIKMELSGLYKEQK